MFRRQKKPDANDRLIKFEGSVNFEYCVAIHFGAHGARLGYASTKTKQIQIVQNSKYSWVDKCDILLTYDGILIAFGVEAAEKLNYEFY